MDGIERTTGTSKKLPTFVCLLLPSLFLVLLYRQLISDYIGIINN